MGNDVFGQEVFGTISGKSLNNRHAYKQFSGKTFFEEYVEKASSGTHLHFSGWRSFETGFA